ATPLPPTESTAAAVERTEPGNGRAVDPSSSVLPVTQTVAPASPRPTAQPRPTPRLAPVTSATTDVKVFSTGSLIYNAPGRRAPFCSYANICSRCERPRSSTPTSTPSTRPSSNATTPLCAAGR